MPSLHHVVNPQPMHNRTRLDPTPDMDRFNYPGPGTYNAPSQFDVRKECGPPRVKPLLRGGLPRGRNETPGPGAIPALPTKKHFSTRGTWAQEKRFKEGSENKAKETRDGDAGSVGSPSTMTTMDRSSRSGAVPPLASMLSGTGQQGFVNPVGALTGSGARGVNNVASSCFRQPMKDQWAFGRDPFGLAATLRGLELPHACSSARCRLREERRRKHPRFKYRDLDNANVDAHCSFGTPFKQPVKLGPGPGTYTLPEPKKPGPKFLKGDRQTGTFSAPSTGALSPCDYSPEYHYIQAKMPQAVLYLTS